MTNYEKLIATLKEVFMLDKAELDFGIYRIMNQKRNDIEAFLETGLLPQVKQVLQQHVSTDKNSVRKDHDEALKQASALGADPDTLPKVKAIKEQLSRAADVTALENEVFSHLASFFKRYFDNGDFISQRRYKRDVYSIPYEGEEVKLHWANHDQYYIKTGEYFKNYRFRISNNRSVAFELVAASTEKDNNKAQQGKERRFAIYAEKPLEVVDDTLKLYFTYEPVDKKLKREDLLQQAFDTVKTKIPADFLEVLRPDPTPTNKTRTLLQKHLNDYTARNTFDYFIHKDLGGFLRRELDFYIKNEVLFIDDINTRSEGEFLQQLSLLKAIKTIGEKIITFLDSLEDFQKKLWLKKKFVVETNYCITLDRVPKELYPAIAANEAQVAEWVKLFAIDEINSGTMAEIFGPRVGFSTPITIEFLKQNPFLVLDTAFFDDAFKVTLLQSFDDVDEQVDGVLINSENFQALQLLEERYKEKVKCIYIDPPYNTEGSEIIYKNGYKSSSWIALLNDRIHTSTSFLSDEGVFIGAIDDAQQRELNWLISENFGGKLLGTIALRSNPSGRPTEAGYAVSHEYMILAGRSKASKIGRMIPTKEQMARFNEKDDDGLFEWRNLRREGSNSDRSARRALYYPIYINGSKIRVPKMEWDEVNELWIVLEKPLAGEQVVLPNNDKNEEKTWRWEHPTVTGSLDKLSVRKDRTGKDYVYYKRRPHEAGVVSVSSWFDAKYSATEHGTAVLKALFRKSPFSYPKSIHAVTDAIYIGGISRRKTLVLDYFAGSGTTGHAVINLNREDDGKRKYILVEMGEYFDTVTKPRIQKVVYSKDWKDGKPQSREGISHCFKYIRLESYEDTLNNLDVRRGSEQELALEHSPAFKEDYLLQYMLEVESRKSLLNTEWFVNPFNFRLNITRQNETVSTAVDLVETFNYLIGLRVKTVTRPKPGYVVITGANRKEESILVVWRDCTLYDNAALNEFLHKSRYNPLDNEFNRIYVNGDNNVENLKTGEEQWKVVLIEEEFKRRMFEG